jgi:hypothetical protein
LVDLSSENIAYNGSNELEDCLMKFSSFIKYYFISEFERDIFELYNTFFTKIDVIPHYFLEGFLHMLELFSLKDINLQKFNFNYLLFFITKIEDSARTELKDKVPN